MKNNIYKTVILAMCAMALSIASIAQLPNFTKVDTGAITVMPGPHGCGSCFDMDRDGDLDLLIANSGAVGNRDFSIFKNEQNGCFVEMPGFIYGEIMLSSWGDVDNDGDVDLFTGLPDRKLRHWVNKGYGDYKIKGYATLRYPSYYPSLIDLNKDGFLDMVGIDREGSVCYNDGNGGFYDAVDLGLLHDQPNTGLHGISWGDPDDDGDFDFYGGYTSEIPGGGNSSKNACFLNNGDGTFIKSDETSVIVEDTTSITSCVNWVDYDNDGDMDLYVLNATREADGPLSALYENLGNMQFTKHVFEDEMYRNSCKVSSIWGDLDNDADLDLYVTVENNEHPWGGTSATPYNLLFLNEGSGDFTNILDHSLALEDSHTAFMLDHDNDGDLDVILVRYSWIEGGTDNLFLNEGNDNSWVVLTCEGTMSNRSAIGTRIYAKCFVNGEHITQTREITPINGHLTYANLRVHFGLGDANVIDTLIIRWPSGHIDEYVNVKANQFYRAIEDESLEIDFKATNYIQYSPAIPDTTICNGTPISIDLNEYFHFMKGDTVPEITGDTLTFSVFLNENPDAVDATIDGNMLSLEGKMTSGLFKIQIVATTGFTERLGEFKVNTVDCSGLNDYSLEQDINIYPNPIRGISDFRFRVSDFGRVTLTIYDLHGREVATVVDERFPPGEHVVSFDAGSLPPGVYIYRKLDNWTVGSWTTGKLIKF